MDDDSDASIDDVDTSKLFSDRAEVTSCRDSDRVLRIRDRANCGMGGFWSSLK